MKLKFRGFDNPANSEKKEVYYGDGVFTVGKIYETVTTSFYGSDHPHQPYFGASMDYWPDAHILNDEGDEIAEELVYFDIVE